jgi:hypothetical protein
MDAAEVIADFRQSAAKTQAFERMPPRIARSNRKRWGHTSYGAHPLPMRWSAAADRVDQWPCADHACRESLLRLHRAPLRSVVLGRAEGRCGPPALRAVGRMALLLSARMVLTAEITWPPVINRLRESQDTLRHSSPAARIFSIHIGAQLCLR